jgi:osmotically-inducible protein OsmY
VGILSSTFRRTLPLSRAGAALWAWQHRKEITGWAGWAASSAPRLLAGDTRDVVTEGRLRARLAGDGRTRAALSGLEVEVREGVAVLRGRLAPEAHDLVVDVATGTSGVQRVRDEITDARRR